MARLRFALSAIPPIGSPPEAEFHFALIERRVSRARASPRDCTAARFFVIGSSNSAARRRSCRTLIPGKFLDYSWDFDGPHWAREISRPRADRYMAIDNALAALRSSNVDWNQFQQKSYTRVEVEARRYRALNATVLRSSQIAVKVNVLMSPLRRAAVLFTNMKTRVSPFSLSLSLSLSPVLFPFIALSRDSFNEYSQFFIVALSVIQW